MVQTSSTAQMQGDENQEEIKAVAASSTTPEGKEPTAVNEPETIEATEEEVGLIELEDLEDIEFLLDEIEDQIAPLAL